MLSGTKDSETGWFPSNYVDNISEQLSKTDELYDTTAEPLEVVITLYAFSPSSAEELGFQKDERLVET